MSRMPTGCRPSHPERLARGLASTRKMKELPPPPNVFLPRIDLCPLDILGNDVYGTCVFAGEGNAIQFTRVSTNLTATPFNAQAIVAAYLAYNRGLDCGADITSFLDWMGETGLYSDDGTIHRVKRHGAIDPRDPYELRQGIALFRGVKMAVASAPIDAVYNGTNGWYLRHAHRAPLDHDIELVGYATVDVLGQLLQVAWKPRARDFDAKAFLAFSWGTLGIIEEHALEQIAWEAHVRIISNDRGDARDWDLIADQDYADLLADEPDDDRRRRAALPSAA
jgi:hypothetical protein